MCKLLKKEAKFEFDSDCVEAFNCLKELLVSTPVIVTPDWSSPFELMCDASGIALGLFLGQRIENLFHPIYYPSKTFNDAQRNYTIIEQEF